MQGKSCPSKIKIDDMHFIVISVYNISPNRDHRVCQVQLRGSKVFVLTRLDVWDTSLEDVLMVHSSIAGATFCSGALYLQLAILNSLVS